MKTEPMLVAHGQLWWKTLPRALPAEAKGFVQSVLILGKQMQDVKSKFYRYFLLKLLEGRLESNLSTLMVSIFLQDSLAAEIEGTMRKELSQGDESVLSKQKYVFRSLRAVFVFIHRLVLIEVKLISGTL